MTFGVLWYCDGERKVCGDVIKVRIRYELPL